MTDFVTFLTASIIAGLVTTSFGGLFIFLFKEAHSRKFDLANGFAAGLMLAASIFSLLLPGLEMGGVKEVLIGYLIGMFFVLMLKDRVHVFYYKLTGESPDPTLTKALIIFVAITLHNMPEGMAVGVAFASGSLALGLKVALAIGIQNIPEGFAVSIPLIATGKISKRKGFGLAVISGLVEPINGIIAYIAVLSIKGLLPYMFGFCAGAMMFVVINEMIPESQHGEYFDKSTLAILFGFLLMFLLDVSL